MKKLTLPLSRVALGVAFGHGLVCASFGLEPQAYAGEIQLDLAATARASTWRADFGGGGALRLGYRFARIVAIDFQGWEELWTVDRRLNTGLTGGVSGFIPLERVRPSMRLYFIHQHEEGLVSAEDHPFGTIFGIGAGIRHRAGGGGSLGLEIVFAKKAHVEYVAVADGSVTWFPDDTLGPGAYFGISGGVGLNYSLPGLP